MRFKAALILLFLSGTFAATSLFNDFYTWGGTISEKNDEYSGGIVETILGTPKYLDALSTCSYNNVADNCMPRRTFCAENSNFRFASDVYSYEECVNDLNTMSKQGMSHGIAARVLMEGANGEVGYIRGSKLIPPEQPWLYSDVDKDKLPEIYCGNYQMVPAPGNVNPTSLLVTDCYGTFDTYGYDELIGEKKTFCLKADGTTSKECLSNILKYHFAEAKNGAGEEICSNNRCAFDVDDDGIPGSGVDGVDPDDNNRDWKLWAHRIDTILGANFQNPLSISSVLGDFIKNMDTALKSSFADEMDGKDVLFAYPYFISEGRFGQPTTYGVHQVLVCPLDIDKDGLPDAGCDIVQVDCTYTDRPWADPRGDSFDCSQNNVFVPRATDIWLEDITNPIPSETNGDLNAFRSNLASAMAGCSSSGGDKNSIQYASYHAFNEGTAGICLYYKDNENRLLIPSISLKDPCPGDDTNYCGIGKITMKVTTDTMTSEFIADGELPYKIQKYGINMNMLMTGADMIPGNIASLLYVVLPVNPSSAYWTDPEWGIIPNEVSLVGNLENDHTWKRGNFVVQDYTIKDGNIPHAYIHARPSLVKLAASQELDKNEEGLYIFVKKLNSREYEEVTELGSVPAYDEFKALFPPEEKGKRWDAAAITRRMIPRITFYITDLNNKLVPKDGTMAPGVRYKLVALVDPSDSSNTITKTVGEMFAQSQAPAAGTLYSNPSSIITVATPVPIISGMPMVVSQVVTLGEIYHPSGDVSFNTPQEFLEHFVDFKYMDSFIINYQSLPTKIAGGKQDICEGCSVELYYTEGLPSDNRGFLKVGGLGERSTENGVLGQLQTLKQVIPGEHLPLNLGVRFVMPETGTYKFKDLVVQLCDITGGAVSSCKIIQNSINGCFTVGNIFKVKDGEYRTDWVMSGKIDTKSLSTGLLKVTLGSFAKSSGVCNPDLTSGEYLTMVNNKIAGATDAETVYNFIRPLESSYAKKVGSVMTRMGAMFDSSPDMYSYYNSWKAFETSMKSQA